MRKSSKTLLGIIICIIIFTILFVLATSWMPGIIFFPICFLHFCLVSGQFCTEKMSEMK